MVKQSRNDETLPNLTETYQFNTNFINPKKKDKPKKINCEIIESSFKLPIVAQMIYNTKLTT